ncbi:MAG: hypothetical protein WA005_12505 [Candidatus Binataceae bacterium]
MECAIAISAVAQAVCALFLVVFTGLLAYYGYRGWRAATKTLAATEIAANAAKTSAEALIRIEWPRLLVERFDVGPIPEDPPPNWPNVVVGFRNYGRTATFVTEIFIASQLKPSLEPDPTYWSPIPMRPTIAVAPNDKFTQSVPLATHLRRGDLDAILQGKTNYWVYGYVKCLDVRGDTHMTGFCARWRVKPDIWSHDGPPSYTYNTYSEGH